MSSEDFTPDRLLRIVEHLPGNGRLIVAYSGGRDSHVLLHALAACRPRPARPLAAAHVDHGLHPESRQWAAHCRAVCAGLGVDLRAVSVDARPRPGRSPEATARAARYEALRELVAPGDVLLTAHHADDQAETVMLQLLRGAGPHGLAAMPPVREFGPALHARPLLGFSSEALRAYAERVALAHVVDPSNADPAVDRSYLRALVMPVLRARWPGLDATFGRVAGHQAALAEMEAALGDIDARAARAGAPGNLDVAALGRLSRARRGNAVRSWLRSKGLPLPTAAQLERVLVDVVASAPDAAPCVAWPGAEIRRYRGALRALAPAADQPGGRTFSWVPPEPIELPGGSLTASRTLGRGLSVRRCARARLEVGFRLGGERCRPGPGARTRSLKKLLQEWGVPPWERDSLPLVRADGELVAVADRCVCAGWEARGEEPGWLLRWERSAGGVPGPEDSRA